MIANRVRIVLDVVAQNARKSFADFRREVSEADGALNKIKATATGAVTVVQRNAAAFAAAGVAIGGGLYKMAEGAAETDAAFSSLEQIAGETIAQDVAGWAEDGVKAFGLSDRAMFTHAKNLGNIANSAGKADDEMRDFIESHLKMAADFAAFQDTSPDQVIRDMQAAYNGSTETLQKYGIVANDTHLKELLLVETGEKITGTLTYQERAMALNLALKEKHVEIEGQWARESGELAGQQVQFRANLTNLSDAIARGALPVMTKLTAGASKAVGAFDSLPGPVKAATGTMGAFTAGGLLLLAAIGKIVGAVRPLVTSIRNLGSTARSAATTGFAALNVAMAAYAAHTYSAAQRAEQFAANMKRVEEATDTQTLADFAEFLQRAVATGLIDVTDYLRQMAQEAPVAAQKLYDAGVLGAEAQEVLGDEIAKARDEVNAAQKAQEAYQDTLGDVEEATDDVATATDKARKANELHVRSINAQRDAMFEALGAAFDYEKSIRATEQAVDDLTAAEEELGVVNESGVAGAAEREAAENKLRGERIKVAEQMLAQAEAYSQEMGAIEGSTAAALLQRDELVRLQQQYPEVRAEVERYIEILNSIPEVRRTQLVVTTSGSVTTKQTTNQYGRLVAGADGGVVTRPTMALIGEAGPEAVVPLHRTPGSAPLGSLGGQTVVHAHFPAGFTPADAERTLRRWERRQGPRGES